LAGNVVLEFYRWHLNLQPDGSGFVFIHDKRIMNPSPYYFTEAQLRKVMTSLLCPVLFVLAQDGLLKSVDRAFKVPSSLVLQWYLANAG
jgi:hypothetical protein